MKPAARGRVLFLTRDAGCLRAQLTGAQVTEVAPGDLAPDVSTDELAPAWASYYFDERLAEHCLTGFRGGSVGKGELAGGGFELLVAGENFGCGSSRETAPFALLLAGVRLVLAPSFGRIFRQNAQNIGLAIATDFGVLARFSSGEPFEPLEDGPGEDPIARAVAGHGGLLAYARARRSGAVALPALGTPARPMTLAERIIAEHAVTDARGEEVGAPGVAPGDSLFVRADWRFSHEYVTPMADALFRRAFGEGARVSEPARVLLFRDHLTFAAEVLARDPRRLPLLAQAELLPRAQAEFAERQGIRLLGERPEGGGSEAICHEAMLESFAEPGSVVVGTDSHTSTAGAVGCLAFGVGSTDMAAAWLTRDVRLAVPETVRVELSGCLRPGVTAKDAMLALFAADVVRTGGVTGRVLEFGGRGLATLPLDERATLTNLSVEAGALTGIAELERGAAEELARLRGGNAEAILARARRPDSGARYAALVELDLSGVEPMLALPGDPKRVETVSGFLARGAPQRIDIAYAGSCTGGKRSDMDAYARVFGPAAARGERVPAGVRLFVQVASETVRRYAEERGYLGLFEAVGATVLGPACGACIAAGPGTSESPDEVTISAGSRNYPGRSGPGKVFLASPLVVAASALAGVVSLPKVNASLPGARASSFGGGSALREPPMKRTRARTPGNRAGGFQIGPGVWTRLGYRAFDADGELLEGAEGETACVFGYGALLPPIEAAIDGLAVGATRSVELAPCDAFGERRPELELEIARDEFPEDVEPGDRFDLERDDGSEVVARILAVSEDAVVVDMNHPLAGQKVRFELNVLEARAASPEELQIAEAALLAEAEGPEDPSEGLIPLGGLLRRGGQS